MPCIYLIRNQVGDVIYVGQTINEKRRLREHRRVLGKTVTMEVIVSDPPDIGLAEKHWIGFYRANGACLANISNGGRGRDAVTAETKAKLSRAKHGKKKHQGFGAKLSAITKGRPHAWTEAGRARAASTQIKPGENLLELASEDGRQRHRENSIAIANALTFEQRSARATKAWANLSEEQHAQRRAAIGEGRIKAGAQPHWKTADPAQLAAARAKISEKLKAAWARRKSESRA